MKLIPNIFALSIALSINAMEKSKKPLRKSQSFAARLMKDKKPSHKNEGMPLRAWIAQNKQKEDSGSDKKAFHKSADDIIQGAIEFLESVELEIEENDIEAGDEN